MINTSTAAFVVESGSQQKYDGSSIDCEPTYNQTQQTFYVRLNVLDSVSTAVIGYGSLTVTKAEVDAESGAGSGETAPWFNALERAVKTKLSAMTGNASTTFTIV